MVWGKNIHLVSEVQRVQGNSTFLLDKCKAELINAVTHEREALCALGSRETEEGLILPKEQKRQQ